MPKLKSHRGAKKRFKISASGKVMAKKAGNRHILTKKSSKLKRQKRSLVALNTTNSKKVAKLLET